VLTRTVLTRTTTLRAAVGHRVQWSQPRALAAPHPDRSPRSPDRSNAADTDGSSCYPDDLPKGYRAVSRGARSSKSRSRVGPLDAAQSGAARSMREHEGPPLEESHTS
jgi:hypothetical protein